MKKLTKNLAIIGLACTVSWAGAQPAEQPPAQAETAAAEEGGAVSVAEDGKAAAAVASTDQSIEQVMGSAQEDLKAALEERAKLQQQIGVEKSPLARKMNDL